MTTQIRNNEMVNLLRADFQARYEPNYAWQHAVSAYMNLPGLRAFYPFTSVNESGNPLDVSGQGRTLTNVNLPTFNIDGLVTYANFNGTTQSFTRADEAGLDFTGTDTHNNAAIRGFTIAMWIYINNYNGFQALIAKYNATAIGSNYGISLNAAGTTSAMGIYTGGSSFDTTFAGTISTGAWHFCCYRYLPSTKTGIFVDGVETTRTVGVPASLNNSAIALTVGASIGNNNFDGRMALLGLYAACISDSQLSALYENTRPAFGR